MNKSAIRNFAVWARVNLMDGVAQKAFEYGIEKNGSFAEFTDSIGGRLLTTEEKNKRNHLIARIKEIGYHEVIEEVAYTWFNRFMALRFMEVNEYLPSRIRVFTNEKGEFEPDILREALTVELEGLERNKIVECIERQKTEELYRYLLVTQCNALSDVLSPLFTKLDDYVELLLPNNLLRKDSVLDHMVRNIPEEDWKEQVEIIGWLYQYYISVKKDEVFASKKTITQETLPAVTQLFTPDWIVRYMAENSVGRIWLESYPNSSLKSEMRYYVEEPTQTKEVIEKIEEIRYKNVNPLDIKVIEPCCGSGHILVYVFDLLYKMYEESGYNKREIPALILKNNLFGLDVDKRAAQLASFSLTMKARSMNARFFSENYYTKPQVYEIYDSSALLDMDYRKKFVELRFSAVVRDGLEHLVETFAHAKEIGSLIKMRKIDFSAIEKELAEVKERESSALYHFDYISSYAPILEKLLCQAKILSDKYDVVITNPPYACPSNMEGYVKDYAQCVYPNTKQDMFAMFIEHGFDWLTEYGFNAMVTMQSWMFLSSFEKMRKDLLSKNAIVTMSHMENMVMGIAFGTNATVWRKNILSMYNGQFMYIHMSDLKKDGNDNLLPKAFPIINERYKQSNSSNFSKIPGSPIAYWVSKKLIEIFNNPIIGDILQVRQGTSTGDNEKFLRNWFEVSIKKVSLNHYQKEKTSSKWYPATKGGDFRKWYGNNDFIVDWENDGARIKKCSGSAVRNPNANFLSGLTWTGISSKALGIRYCPHGFVFLISGKAIVGEEDKLYYVLAFCCSIVAYEILKITSPTLSFEVGYISNLPIKIDTIKKVIVDNLTKNNISLSKTDWDSYETSWDFKKHPLV